METLENRRFNPAKTEPAKFFDFAASKFFEFKKFHILEPRNSKSQRFWSQLFSRVLF